jgi:hypothetical protein
MKEAFKQFVVILRTLISTVLALILGAVAYH